MADETGENRNSDGTFKPGVSGNPAGRPPGTYSIVGELRRKLEEVPKGQVKSYGEQIVDTMLKKAIVDEDAKILTAVMEHMDGAPKQSVTHDIPQALVDLLTHVVDKGGNK